MVNLTEGTALVDGSASRRPRSFDRELGAQWNGSAPAATQRASISWLSTRRLLARRVVGAVQRSAEHGHQKPPLVDR